MEKELKLHTFLKPFNLWSHGKPQGLIDGIYAVLNKKKEVDEFHTELTRTDIIKCIQSEKVRFRGVNLSGLDLSKLVISWT